MKRIKEILPVLSQQTESRATSAGSPVRTPLKEHHERELGKLETASHFGGGA